MEQVVTIMLPPLVACLILTGIHTYLGLHVVSRGVIFVDLALAQVAALGSTFAFLVGFDPKSPAGYFYSLGFAFLGAAVFSISRLRDQRVPQEALIGIVFAVASSAAILIADRAPQGAEHVEEMLTGSILWVTWPTIIKTALIYAVIGGFHVLFRKRFLLISMRPQEAEQAGVAVRWWDFLFYVSFGFVITSSVAMAGVLLVFSFLIVPSVIGMLYSNRIGARLTIGWISGLVVSVAGLYLSYRYDLPSGPSVVCSFGVVLLGAGIVRYLSQADRKPAAWARVAAGMALAAGTVVLTLQFRPAVGLEAGSPASARQAFVNTLSSIASPAVSAEEARELLRTQRQALIRALEGHEHVPIEASAVQRMGKLGDPSVVPILRLIYENSRDPWIQFYASCAQLRLGDTEAVHNFIHILSSSAPVFLKSQLAHGLREMAGQDFGFDPLRSSAENRRALDRIEVWWHQNADNLKPAQAIGFPCGE